MRRIHFVIFACTVISFILLICLVLSIGIGNGGTGTEPVDEPPISSIPKNRSKSNGHQISKRLVIFLSDGLRADALFDVVSNLPDSFIKQKMENGKWGISLAAPPTLSKPAIISMFSGKVFSSSEAEKLINASNPDAKTIQNVDNIFRYIRNVFFVGNGEIPGYFGRHSDFWLKDTYATYDATHCWEDYECYDEWSFTRLTDFLSSYESMEVKDDLVIFVYLYGQDYCAHNRKPLSRFCLDEIKFIDRRIGDLFNRIEETFDDGLTTYILTSDHGMDDKGHHKFNSKQETESPFVIWGNGVAKTGIKNGKNSTRLDINQVDMAPLFSILLDKPIPEESIGVFHPELLSYDEQVKAKGMLSNVKGLQSLISKIMDKNYELDSNIRFEMKNKTDKVEEDMQLGNFSLVISNSKNLVTEYLDIYKNLTQDLQNTIYI